MEAYQQQFVDFLFEAGALKFGTFTLKSGRVSPYFFNSGSFDTGPKIDQLGFYYAAAIHELCREIDAACVPTVIFGPAYKGIPLAVAASIALNRSFGITTGYLFDRKEEKGHGDRGTLVGYKPTETDRIVIVDDVITSGDTKLEAIELLKASTPASIIGLVIALNRQEQTGDSADPVAALERRLHIPVRAIATLDMIIEALSARLDESTLAEIHAYRKRYGVENIGVPV